MRHAPFRLTAGRPIPGLLLLAALVAASSQAFAAGSSSDGPQIRIESPAPGETVSERIHQARVTGTAIAAGAKAHSYDVMLAIDVSGSTKVASGTDVDGDGEVGVNPRLEKFPAFSFPPDVWSTDPQDSILHAEVRAALALIESLDPRRVRVGVISFAGEVDPLTGLRKRLEQEDAWVEVPLTADYASIRQGLIAILARGPAGATNFAAGVRVGVRELAGLSGARSVPRPEARKVLLFLTDGKPSLPIDKGSVTDPGDVDAAIRSAQLAARAGISINTYALGPEALQYPRAVTEMARVTGGTYTPIQNPGDIIVLLRGVTFANVEDVVFANLTTGDFSTDVRLAPDGSFTGYVPMRDGKNRLRVSALASDGRRTQLEFDVQFASEDLSDREKLRELEQLRRATRELQLKRESERVERFREEQRKELEIRRADGEG